MELCSYGCGQKAQFQLKNDKWCCKRNYRSCKEFIKKRKWKSPWNKGKNNIYSIETIEKMKINHIGKKQSEGTRIKRSKALKGRKRPLFSEEWRSKMSNARYGKTYEEIYGKVKAIKIKNKKSEEMKNGKANYMNSLPKQGYKNHKEWMLNKGHEIRKQIKNPSEPELKLRRILKELYPTCEHTYHILKYDIDIVIPEYKIAIEYDGWHHFNIPGRKEYDIQRQKEIEQEGWKFLRYNIFQKFPTLEQVKEDVRKIL